MDDNTFKILGILAAGIFALMPSWFAYSLAMKKLREVADDQAKDRKIITETRDWVDGLKLEVLEKQWLMAEELASFKDTPVSRDVAKRAKAAYDEHLKQRDRNVAKDVQIAVEIAVAKDDPLHPAAVAKIEADSKESHSEPT